MIEVESHIVHVIDNYMGRVLSDALEKGWELMVPPIYLFTSVASGYNVHKSPHFLILMKRETITPLTS